MTIYISKEDFEKDYLYVKRIKDNIVSGLVYDFREGLFLELLLIDSDIFTDTYFNNKVRKGESDTGFRDLVSGGLRKNNNKEYYTKAKSTVRDELIKVNVRSQGTLRAFFSLKIKERILPLVKESILEEIVRESDDNKNIKNASDEEKSKAQDRYDMQIEKLWYSLEEIVTPQNTYYKELYDEISQNLRNHSNLEDLLSLLLLISIFQDDIYLLYPKYCSRWSEEGFFPFHPEIKPLTAETEDKMPGDSIPLDTIDFFRKALSKESELGKISNIDMAFHGGTLWLYDGKRHALLIKAIENGVKIRVLINTTTQVENICSHMRQPGLHYTGFEKNANEWRIFMEAHSGLVEVRVAQIPLLHRTYIIKGGCDKGWSNITYYTYGHDISEAQCSCFSNTDNIYRLYLEEFNYIWDKTSKPLSEYCIEVNNEILINSSLMVKSDISHISDDVNDYASTTDKSIIEDDYISRFSKSISIRYQKLMDNIEDVNGYTLPFVPSDFSDLIAHNAEGIIELDRRSVINHDIDPIIYEVFLAQKIARSCEQMDFKNVLQLIHLTSDCWRLFVNSSMQIIGYWVFVGLKSDSFKTFSSGTVDESKLTLQDVCFIDMPGWYNGYLLLSGTVTEHRIPSVTYAVYNSWLQTLESYSNNNIFFSEISSMVASPGGISTLTHIGMEAYASYLLGGKMFRYNLIEIDKIQYLKKHFPHMIQNYMKELKK